MNNVDIKYEDEFSCPHCGTMDTSVVLVMDGVCCSPMRKFLLRGRKRNMFWRKGEGNLQVGIQGAHALTFPVASVARHTNAMKLIMKRLAKEAIVDAGKITVKKRELDYVCEDSTNIITGLSPFLRHVTHCIGSTHDDRDSTSEDLLVQIRSEYKEVRPFLDDLSAGTPVHGGLVKNPKACVEMLIKLLNQGQYTSLLSRDALITFPSLHRLLLAIKVRNIDECPGLRAIITALVKTIQVMTPITVRH